MRPCLKKKIKMQIFKKTKYRENRGDNFLVFLYVNDTSQEIYNVIYIHNLVDMTHLFSYLLYENNP